MRMGGVRPLIPLLTSPCLPVSVGFNIGVSLCLSPLSFTSAESNPVHETSYSSRACRHARSQGDAATYGGKMCGTKRSTVC